LSEKIFLDLKKELVEFSGYVQILAEKKADEANSAMNIKKRSPCRRAFLCYSQLCYAFSTDCDIE